MSLLRQIVSGAAQPSTVLIERIDRHNTQEDTPYRPGWHPSELSQGFCPLHLALRDLGWIRVRNRIEGRVNRIFDNGHYFHERMQRYLREMGLVLRDEHFGDPEKDYLCEEVPLVHECGLTGRADNFVLVDGVLSVVDYKSIRQEQYNLLHKPLDKHERQVWLYLGMVDAAIPKHLADVPIQGLLVYENKNDQSLKEFVVRWGREGKDYFDQTVRTLQDINQAIADKDPWRLECNCGDCPTREDLGR